MDINDYQKRFVLIEENLRLIGQELQLFREDVTEYKGSQYYYHTIPDADRRNLLHLSEALKEVVEREIRWGLQDLADAARNSLGIQEAPKVQQTRDRGFKTEAAFDAQSFVAKLSPELKAALALKIKQGL
jgi:hypothetical protein